jgi:hypothetical protein
MEGCFTAFNACGDFEWNRALSLLYPLKNKVIMQSMFQFCVANDTTLLFLAHRRYRKHRVKLTLGKIEF